MYRPQRGSFAIENFDPQLCTHVVYAFAGLDFERDAVKSLGECRRVLLQLAGERVTRKRCGRSSGLTPALVTCTDSRTERARLAGLSSGVPFLVWTGSLFSKRET